ncbi:MAG TPA: ATP-binding protein [Thermoanaerobaculia bacterium]|nr:ATP-binding protein [Thermoanaerobaculia bacterium]
MRFLSGISPRLLAFNLLLVFLPAAGFLYFEVYERQLLEAQERAMVQQGRVLAAALSGHGEIDAAAAKGLLQRLEQRTEARLRVVGRHGELLADSSVLGATAPPPVPSASGVILPLRGGESKLSYPVPRETRESLLYRGGAVLYRLYRRLSPDDEDSKATSRRTETFYSPRGPLLGPEVQAALAGRYGATTRPTRGDERSLTLHSAIPVRSNGEVVGAVLVSQSTFRILGALVEVRLDIFQVFLASLLAAVVLSLLVSTTIALPLRRLRNEANALVDRRGRLRGSFRGSRRADEIGDLARALEQLTRRLEGHLRFIESFASDVSHEFKNPLASIRSATEMLAEVENPADRERLLAVAQREVARMERLLSGVREITEIDARLEEEAVGRVDLKSLLSEVAEGFRLRGGRDVGIELRTPAEPVVVRASAERLAQVFENLLDNAVGFSPPGSAVTLELQRQDGVASVIVADRGPGIPEEHLGRIFDRFFSYRPGEPHARNGHTGLGLAITRVITEGYGGTIAARNRQEGGAAFEIRLPVLYDP